MSNFIVSFTAPFRSACRCTDKERVCACVISALNVTVCVCVCVAAATPEFNSSFQPLANSCLQTGVAAVSTPNVLGADFGGERNEKDGLPTQDYGCHCKFITVCHHT